jgi:hypothetical protein
MEISYSSQVLCRIIPNFCHVSISKVLKKYHRNAIRTVVVHSSSHSDLWQCLTIVQHFQLQQIDISFVNVSKLLIAAIATLLVMTIASQRLLCS